MKAVRKMNNLFNEKILNKKAGEEVNLDKNNLRERRKYLDKWIDNLDNGTLNNSKEEEFQGEFLHDIFTTVLNAVNKSDGKTEWNLQRETKTELDGQKADGVLGFFDNEKIKQKKDGIFYNPKYITKYIMENSIKNRVEMII